MKLQGSGQWGIDVELDVGRKIPSKPCPPANRLKGEKHEENFRMTYYIKNINNLNDVFFVKKVCR
jgi:hypothetical protein